MKSTTLRSASTVFLLGLGTTGCTSEVSVNSAEAEASLRATAIAYQSAATAKDAQAVVGFYDEDALMVPPNADLVEGIVGVRDYRFGFIETAGVTLDFELMRVQVSERGDMGWTFAIGDITIQTDEGPPGRDQVRDFHTWRRHPDGAWKVVVDMWNSGAGS